MQQERDSFVFISTSDTAIARVKQTAEFLSLSPVFQTNLQDFLDEDKLRPRTLLVDLRGLTKPSEEMLPKVRRLLPKTQIVGIVDDLKDKKPEWFVQHFITSEALMSFALEFFLFQKIFCEYFEISPTDLFPDTMVYFNAYHFLPLNLKYLPLVHENFILSEKKHKRIEMLRALYIFRGDSSAYVQYIEKYFDQFNVGLKKRTKSRLYQLLVEWRDLVYSYLLEVREVESCTVIRPDFMIWLNDLLNYFSSSGDAWALIHEMSRLSCFEFDQSLMEIIVASYLSRNIGEDEAEKMIDLRLLLTLSRLRNESLLFKKWHLGQDFSEEEKTKWSLYPGNIVHYPQSPDFPKDVSEDFNTYAEHFIKKTNADVKSGRLVYTYLGEVIISVMKRLSSEQFKKDDFLESVMVKCKADGILSEAWMEELRQFLKK